MSIRQYVPAAAPVWMIAVGWVLLTRASGLTYHLFPLVIAAAAPVLPKMLFGRPLPRPIAFRFASGGLLAVAAGWLTMVAGGFAPTATFVTGQPGGVLGEVILFALLGAYRGTMYALRPVRAER